MSSPPRPSASSIIAGSVGGLFCCTALLLLASAHTPTAAAYNILAVFPTISKSHYISGGALMRELAAKGHNVTVISPFPQAEKVANYRDIEVLGVQQAAYVKFFKPLIKDVGSLNALNMFESHLMYQRVGLFTTNYTLKHPAMREFLARRDEHFDLVVCELTLTDALLGLGHHFGAPVVGFSSAGATVWTSDVVGSPTPISYVPNKFLGYPDRMTFAQRLVNAAFTLFERLTLTAHLRQQAALYDELWPADGVRPSLEALRANVSLVLLNQHFTLNYPRPYVPNMIEVGGLNIERDERRRRPLAADVAEFVAGAEHGVVYFSLGSNVRSSMLSAEMLAALLRTFAGLRERVLWKWELDELPGRPANVLVRKWFAQDAVLAHPGVKLFITHGGLLSTTEAVYHGKPLIGVPVFGDQRLNMQHAEQRGYGVTVALANLTAESLRWALDEVLTPGPDGRNKYAVRAQEISRQYRDQPLTPMQTAVYWVEYVARHGGAPHMRSAAMELSAWQYHSVDVFGCMAGALALLVWAAVRVVRWAVRWLCGGVVSTAAAAAAAARAKKLK